MRLLDERHPADEIGKALSRAGGILTSLSNCYDKAESGFEISVPFIFEAVTAVEKLISGASDQLERLYQNYNLGKQPNVEADEVIAEPPYVQSAFEPESEQQFASTPVSHLAQAYVDQRTTPLNAATPENPNYLGFFGPTEQVSRLASRLDSILENMPEPERSTTEQMIDRPAQTYNELLEKLTAMADVAAYHAHHAPGTDRSLLPVLETLRADVMRIKSVA